MRELRGILEGALGPLYRVEREVRPVGECRLFVAAEQSAGAELLVKVLPARLALTVDATRFEREVLLLSDHLKHPQVVAPRGAGRAGAHVYHTRPFIEGTTLRAHLARDGELPLRLTVDILQDVLGALAHAHSLEIVHGDLKPENVLVAGGRALVADAGVVGAVARCLPDTERELASVELCARPYLPPERRGGMAQAEPRDDVFAVGVLAVEMLTGQPPEGEAEPLEEIRSLPSWLTELVRRSLAVERSERWTDARVALDSVTKRRG